MPFLYGNSILVLHPWQYVYLLYSSIIQYSNKSNEGTAFVPLTSAVFSKWYLSVNVRGVERVCVSVCSVFQVQASYMQNCLGKCNYIWIHRKPFFFICLLGEQNIKPHLVIWLVLIWLCVFSGNSLECKDVSHGCSC